MWSYEHSWTLRPLRRDISCYMKVLTPAASKKSLAPYSTKFWKTLAPVIMFSSNLQVRKIFSRKYYFILTPSTLSPPSVISNTLPFYLIFILLVLYRQSARTSHLRHVPRLFNLLLGDASPDRGSPHRLCPWGGQWRPIPLLQDSALSTFQTPGCHDEQLEGGKGKQNVHGWGDSQGSEKWMYEIFIYYITFTSRPS